MFFSFNPTPQMDQFSLKSTPPWPSSEGAAPWNPLPFPQIKYDKDHTDYDAPATAFRLI